LDRLKTTLLTALVIAILFTPIASAQQAAKLEIVSGNGQMTCPNVPSNTCNTYYPMVVRVSDSSGNPIPGKAVVWQLTVAGNGYAPTFETNTVTDSNGLAVSRLQQTPTQGSNYPFTQSVISATADNLSVSFTETQALLNGNGFPQVTTALDPAEVGMTLSGPAGSTGTTPLHVHVTTTAGAGVPNVSVRLLSANSLTLPYANCSTSAGADPGSTVTDANGIATCYPVFGSIAGSGVQVSVLVGGLDPAYFDYTAVTPERPLNDPVGFSQYTDKFPLAVTPVTPAHAFIVSGNNQNIDPGKTSSPMVVRFTDSTGTVPVGNLSVVWTVSPAGAASVSPVASTTDPTGQTQTTATFSASASGTVSVTATLTGYTGISATFTLSTRVQIASLAKVSGDQQTTQSGQAFAAPLVVQVNGTNGQPLSGQVISFVPTGNATVSVSSAMTDVTGRAQVTVTAGATPGAVTVTAIVANISQVFNLTVIPPGPALSGNSFFNAGGGARLIALSPCSLVTVTASGLAPNVLGTVLNSNAFGPWATTLATDTVVVNNVAAPIYSVANLNGVQQLTFQVPCEVAPAASVPITINVGGGTGTANMPIQAATPGIFETVMSDNSRRAVAIRPDGTFVTLQNPARPGDVVRVYVTGLGPVSPAGVTGALPYVGADSLVLGQVIVGVNNAGARVVNSRVSPNLIGVYEVDFQVPSDAPSGNDIVLSVAVNAPGDSQTRFSNGSKLPITQ
jgi:uncharacterized protein (TIGR03437 family)